MAEIDGNALLLDLVKGIDKKVDDTSLEVKALMTQLKDYNGLRDKLNDTCNMSKNNKSDILEMKDRSKWLFRTVIASIIGYLASILYTIMQH